MFRIRIASSVQSQQREQALRRTISFISKLLTVERCWWHYGIVPTTHRYYMDHRGRWTQSV